MLSWFSEHPQAVMDISHKVFMIFVGVIVFIAIRKREKCHELHQESDRLGDSTYKSLSMQYDDMSTRFTTLLQTHNDLEERYYALKQQQERAVMALRHHFETSDQISKNDLVDILGDYANTNVN